MKIRTYISINKKIMDKISVFSFEKKKKFKRLFFDKKIKSIQFL